jgi:hypothetical protein
MGDYIDMFCAMDIAEILYHSAGSNTVLAQHQVQLAFWHFSAGKCGS